MWQVVDTHLTQIHGLRYAYGRCRQSGYKQMGLRRLRDAQNIYETQPHKAYRLIEDATDILKRAQTISDEELMLQVMLAK